MKRKTPEEKEKLIKAIEKLGVIEGCRQFGISPATYYDWYRRYESGGLNGLGSYKRQDDADYKRMAKENAQLRQLLVEKDLKIQMQAELIKKRNLEWKQ